MGGETRQLPAPDRCREDPSPETAERGGGWGGSAAAHASPRAAGQGSKLEAGFVRSGEFVRFIHLGTLRKHAETGTEEGEGEGEGREEACSGS